ncbi:hypothetical protein Salat_1608600 [Sesamum alatum]|uniref:DUF7086 domain-containing protein n=1 Tax=Sesamum alatum TaxID=300844 RepID=A0AAE1Y6B0_9LAMI|nr:hypothetical protein Salat_1608600 [Sesamum alatum]
MDNYNREMDKRRKISGQDSSIPRNYPPPDEEENDNDFLTLSLFPTTTTLPRNTYPVLHHPPPPPPPPPPPVPILPSPPRPRFDINSPLNNIPVPVPAGDNATNTPAAASPSTVVAVASRPPRTRRTPSRAPREGKSTTITPPFAWATNRRATVHRMSYLISKQIMTIRGEVQCKKCEQQYAMEFDLPQRFLKVASFVADNRFSMCQRAPRSWMNPALPRCRYCEEDNSCKPVISDKKRSINWLFMFLGEMLGCCTLDQLKYFCKHTKNHRTGAKDRVLFLTYIAICKQLEPNGPFEI